METPREAQTRTAKDHLVALNWSGSEGRWPDVGTARAEGPGQGGMANSGGRPMFRTEQQELSQSRISFSPAGSHFIDRSPSEIWSYFLSPRIVCPAKF